MIFLRNEWVNVLICITGTNMGANKQISGEQGKLYPQGGPLYWYINCTDGKQNHEKEQTCLDEWIVLRWFTEPRIVLT